ncbi:hypothetical protein OS493_008683 [Desmophyllum pertusum]|uniref:VWFA domain-containing protein n=1 Tax=Desmophyllum pertusum TaxID=174260 RepID=A0A9X0D426_9CNID|nr:hypothetical protein OS493_008683 [Desmophyllum pertusum]
MGWIRALVFSIFILQLYQLWEEDQFHDREVVVRPFATSLESLVDAELLFQGGTSTGLQEDVRGSFLAAAEETLITLRRRLNVNGHVAIRDVAIVMTDGKSHDNVGSPANLFRRKNIKCYAIGIGRKYNRNQLLQIAAGNRRHVITAGFRRLGSIVNTIQRRACRGARPVRPVAIVMTDGKSYDNVGSPANLFRRKNIKCYAIGIGRKYNRNQLLQIAAGNRRHVITAGFRRLGSIVNTIQRRACRGRTIRITRNVVGRTIRITRNVIGRTIRITRNVVGRTIRLAPSLRRKYLT